MIGKIVIKTAGREAGYKAVIIEELDQNYVFISSGDVNKARRRRVNKKHLKFTDRNINVEPNASDEEVRQALEKENLVEEFKQKQDL